MGGCVGGLAKSPPAITTERHSRRHSSRRGGSGRLVLAKHWWSSSPEKMEDNVGKSNSVERNSPVCSTTSKNQDAQGTFNNTNNTNFVNHALILWNERRREWHGSRSRNRLQMPREPVISWSTTYDDLLATNRHFPEPIPLPEMVDFLVGIWEEEGLYDSP